MIDWLKKNIFQLAVFFTTVATICNFIVVLNQTPAPTWNVICLFINGAVWAVILITYHERGRRTK